MPKGHCRANLCPRLTAIIRLLTAIVAWIIGRWLIAVAVGLMGKVFERGGKIDATLAHYLKSITSVLLNIVLILAILDIFGVKTTSFAALLAGAGLAIGAAWSGMLGNFAAGVFMQVLRPYKVGDFICAGGVTGTVKELGLFATTIVTMDNVVTVVGNGKVFGDNIQNYSALPVRRVDCVAKVANSVNPLDAIARLRPVIAAIPNVAATPAPDIEILDFTPEGPPPVRAPLYAHRPLLAGLFRHAQGHRRDLRSGGLSGAGNAPGIPQRAGAVTF